MAQLIVIENSVSHVNFTLLKMLEYFEYDKNKTLQIHSMLIQKLIIEIGTRRRRPLPFIKKGFPSGGNNSPGKYTKKSICFGE